MYLRVEISCAINLETRRENCHVIDKNRELDGIIPHSSYFHY